MLIYYHYSKFYKFFLIGSCKMAVFHLQTTENLKKKKRKVCYLCSTELRIYNAFLSILHITLPKNYLWLWKQSPF